jgi:phosphoribosylaminoimidazolecarboxamide formyltransferase/IMP cyclohydrolase
MEMARGTDVTDMKRTYRTPVEGEFPGELTIKLEIESGLRYGENPNQPAAVYRFKGISLAELTNIRLAKTGKGGLSATNFMDVARALEILKYFEGPSAAVMKHLIPSGFATQHEGNSLDDIYRKARDADARSAFGSIVVLNKPLDKTTAEAIMESYVEGVAVPEYEEGTMEILEKKKDIRAIQFSNLEKLPRFIGDDVEGLYDLKVLPTGRVIVQKPYLSSIKGPEDLVLDPMVRKKDKETGTETAVVVERDPTPGELRDMLTAWYVNLGVRSNGIVFVKDGITLAVGAGQQERVGAVEQAIIKTYQKAMDREGIPYNPLEGTSGREKLSSNSLEGAVFSSDAFFPFRDSIDISAEVGVTAVIQPGGSVRDSEVIEAVNEHGMAMAFTLERCFAHF